MNIKTIEISETDGVVLTKNGTVVGYVEVKEWHGDSELCAHPVNANYWDTPSEFRTHNSFSTTLSINANLDDMNSSELFIKQIKLLKAAK